jgi:nucleotide-binding universal stress UspA family protein
MLKTDTPFAKHLRKGVEILNEKVVASEVKIRHGVPVEEIVREAQLENYDLVIVGASGVKEGIKGRLLGNLTTKIVDQVKLPVLVIGDRALNSSTPAGNERSEA